MGTKLKIAIETGTHETIGIDLVAMCVNDLIVQGAEPLFFLDYLATAHLDVEVAKTIIAGIATGCTQAGCALIGGETAEMPGMYKEGDYDLAGFSIGAVERTRLLPAEGISQGDVLIGLMSSGIHSNGYSLIRRLKTEDALEWNDPAPWQPAISVARALLEPTRIYVKPLLKVLHAFHRESGLEASSGGIRALAHITGGGLTENLPRVLPGMLTARIDLSTWQPPPVFSWVSRTGRLSESEMLRTFNCGIGMVVVSKEADSEKIIEILNQEGETAIRIGMLETRDPHDDKVDKNETASQVVYTGSMRFER